MFSILDWTLPCRWSVSLLWLWSPVAFMEELKWDHCFISLMACQRRSPVMVGTKPNQLDKVIACWLAIITLMHKHKTGSRLIMVDADMRLLWSMHLPMLISSTKQILGRPLRVRRNGFCFMQLGIYRSPLDIWPVFYTCKDVGYNTHYLWMRVHTCLESYETYVFLSGFLRYRDTRCYQWAPITNFFKNCR